MSRGDSDNELLIIRATIVFKGILQPIYLYLYCIVASYFFTEYIQYITIILVNFHTIYLNIHIIIIYILITIYNSYGIIVYIIQLICNYYNIPIINIGLIILRDKLKTSDGETNVVLFNWCPPRKSGLTPKNIEIIL